MDKEFEKILEDAENDPAIKVGEEIICQVRPGIFKAFHKCSCSDGSVRLFMKQPSFEG